MLRNYFLLNLLLVLIIGILGFKLYSILTYSMDMPSEASVNELKTMDSDVKPKNKVLNEKDFDRISKLDLFRPSRSAPLMEVRKEESAPMKNPPKLFGTVILNDLKTAILEDPETNTTKVYRLNDSIAGYSISEILENKVILSRGDDKVEVKLREDKGIKPAKKPRARPAKRQVRNNTPQKRSPTRTVPQRRRPRRVRPPTSPTDTMQVPE